jgi:hypothetical protein
MTLEIFPLFASLTPSEQLQVFAPGTNRTHALVTNEFLSLFSLTYTHPLSLDLKNELFLVGRGKRKVVVSTNIAEVFSHLLSPQFAFALSNFPFFFKDVSISFISFSSHELFALGVS